MDYAAIARDAGYGVLKYASSDRFFWVCYDDTSGSVYSSEQDAWKACCEENELV